MDDTPLIRILAINIQPEYEERYGNWVKEAYYPLLITVPGYKGFDYCQIVRENPQYTKILAIQHHANRSDMLKVRSDPKLIDVFRDMITTWTSRSEVIWFAPYQLMRSFKTEGVDLRGDTTLKAESAPIIHIEGYAISPEEEEKYASWFIKWGYELYVPLIMKLPGLKEYAWYKLIGVDLKGLPDYYNPKRPVEYPLHLSILRFESIAAYDRYSKSIELAGFREAMRVPFPSGLDYKWYVQYQIVKSWRK